MPINEKPFSDLTQFCGNLLEQLLEQGFQVPIYFVAVGANGSVMAVHYVAEGEHLGARCVAEYVPQSGLTFPIHMMVLDGSVDHAAHAVIKAPEQSTFTIQ
jgi:hypothetical protein